MKVLRNILFLSLIFFLHCKDNDDFVIYTIDPTSKNIRFYWKKENGEIFKNIKNLKDDLNLKNEKLIFAMNGGMYEKNNIPKGLYIEYFKHYRKIDTLKGNGNFYLQPNGIFYLTRNNEAQIVETKKFKNNLAIKFATQSGPMLLLNGTINPIFQKKSKNLNIRNGVGILNDGTLVFVMSKKEINFYDFALMFKKMNCQNALFLDGSVSRAYLPEKNWVQEDGDFGVIIAVSEKK